MSKFEDCETCEGLGRVEVDIWTGWQFGASKWIECEDCNGSGEIEYHYEYDGELFIDLESAEERICDKHPELGDDKFIEYSSQHVHAI